MASAGAPGLEALPHLLHRALLRGEGLLLALDGRLLVVLALADLREDPRLLALLLEALHRILEGLAILHAHAGHSCLSSGFLSGAAGPKTQTSRAQVAPGSCRE